MFSYKLLQILLNNSKEGNNFSEKNRGPISSIEAIFSFPLKKLTAAASCSNYPSRGVDTFLDGLIYCQNS